MYTSFSIENFRLFDRLTIEPLARVNLIVGKNNAGKTTLLEALWLHSGPNLPDMSVRLANFRGVRRLDPRRFLHDVFYDFNPNIQVVLSAEGNWEGDARVLKITSQLRNISTVSVPMSSSALTPRGSQEADVTTASSSEIMLDYRDETGKHYVSTGWLYRSERQIEMGPNLQMKMGNEGVAAQQAEMPEIASAVFLSARHRTEPEEDVEKFGEAELENYGDAVVACLRSVDGRIKGLRTIATDAPAMLYADVGLSRPVPIGFLGDGVGRLLSMTLAFHQARNGIILIDEVENGLHHSVLVDVWERLNWLSHEFNVQIFATTHSDECLEAALNAFRAAGDDGLLTHRISHRKDGIKAATYSVDGLEYSREIGAEIR